MDEDYESIYIQSVAGFAQLNDLALDVKAVYIGSIRESFELPLMPAHVKMLSLDNAHLVGPIAFTEGLIKLYLGGSDAEMPFNAWQWPASLWYISIDRSRASVIDLRRSGITEVVLSQVWTPVDQVLLPEGIRKLTLFYQDYTRLPRLPSSLRVLSISYCLSLTDLSRARGIAITNLVTDVALSLYENFSELTKLSLWKLVDSAPEISLTHLRKLRFVACYTTDPIEVNAPNLESLTLRSSGPLKLRGSFAENVTRLHLRDCAAFPGDEDWSHLEELVVNDTPTNAVIDVPELPWLRQLTVDMPVQSNGVMVATLREHKAAWNQTRRNKRVPLN